MKKEVDLVKHSFFCGLLKFQKSLEGSPSLCLYTGIWLADLCGDFDLDRIHRLRHLEQGIIPVFVNTN